VEITRPLPASRRRAASSRESGSASRSRRLTLRSANTGRNGKEIRLSDSGSSRSFHVDDRTSLSGSHQTEAPGLSTNARDRRPEIDPRDASPLLLSAGIEENIMKELLPKKTQDYQERARHVAETAVRPIAAELDRSGEYPWSVIDALRDANLMGIWIPEEYGGQSAGVLDLCVVVEELSRACGGVGVAYAVNALGSFPIILGGTDEQKERWLPPIATGEKLIAFGLSEKASGSDAGSLRTRAELDGDSYVINGEKKWNTNGNAASFYTVYCSTRPDRGHRGISPILVEKGTPGFEIGKREDLMGIRCVPVHELHFEECRVPAENLLGLKEGKGFANAMMTLDRARPGVAAQALGLAQGAFDWAVRYTSERQQFGQSVLSFQSTQFKVADLATEIEAARHLVYTAARAIDAGLPGISKLAAMAKVFASDVAMKVTTDAVQMFGGYGYCRDYPIEKYMRDAKITQIYEGANQIQRLVIGRALTKEAAAISNNLEVNVEHFPEVEGEEDA
jgi:alkylation response protein AidB-like acyl-CoA dehydrogenase